MPHLETNRERQARDALELMGCLDVPAPLSRSAGLKHAWPKLVSLCVERLTSHGDFEDWWQAIMECPSGVRDVSDSGVPAADLPDTFARAVREVLSRFSPWKKGPFELRCQDEVILLDGEWDCRLKWERVEHMEPALAGRRVLDVGTGNGYFLRRLVGAGADYVLGLEPSVLFSAQHMLLTRLLGEDPIHSLPLTDEGFAPCQTFETVLSMGVLYHRRSPLDHLLTLKSFLTPGGQLVLETIVVDGPEGYSLVPPGRYAQMRNVFFLPSVDTLLGWLRKVGFSHLQAGPVVSTTSREQRTTPWTAQPSLQDFLDPRDATKTKEGHPAPARVIILAQA